MNLPKIHFRLYILSFCTLAHLHLHIYAFDRHFYPKWLALHVISSCIPWESNSWPWQYYYCNALQLNASWFKSNFRLLYWKTKILSKNITLYSVIILHQICHAKCLNNVNVHLSKLVLLRAFNPLLKVQENTVYSKVQSKTVWFILHANITNTGWQCQFKSDWLSLKQNSDWSLYSSLGSSLISGQLLARISGQQSNAWLLNTNH